MRPQHHRGDTGGAGAGREARGKRSRPACPTGRPGHRLGDGGSGGGTGGTSSGIPRAGEKVGDFFDYISYIVPANDTQVGTYYISALQVCTTSKLVVTRN